MSKPRKIFDKISVTGVILLFVYFLFPLIVSGFVVVIAGPEMFKVNDPPMGANIHHYESSRIKVGLFLTLLWWVPAIVYCPFKWFLSEPKKRKNKK